MVVSVELMGWFGVLVVVVTMVVSVELMGRFGVLVVVVTMVVSVELMGRFGRYERAAQPDTVTARSCRHVSGDAGGRISDSVNTDPPRPVDRRTATC